MMPDKKLWGLAHCRSCWVPTWRGGLLVLLVGISLLAGAVLRVHPFLAVNEALTGGALVVEGWSPDYVMEAAKQEFQRHAYDKIYVTGCPLERGALLSEYKTYAELGAATLLHLGLKEDAVQAVPAPEVRRDRTYQSALVLKRWLRERELPVTQFNVYTLGAHSRRTQLLFQKAMGDEARVGVVAIPDQQYDAGRWWKSSEGVRTVIGEAIAYTYARWFFRPPRNP